MISVLIPVYNTLVLSLVKELSRQLNALNVPGEILVFDDHSSVFYRGSNKSITHFDHVVYKELDQNLGRSATRQLLARGAKYEWLLFLDSDSRILHSDFLKTYITAFSTAADVYPGGRQYPAKPKDCKKALHWKYGVERESSRGSKAALHTNNFCIRKELFLQLDFPGFLTRYGHEDTWMQIELTRSGKKISFIENRVEHLQIENTEVFLEKTDEALQNLLLLANVTDNTLLRKHSSLFWYYQMVNRFGLSGILAAFYKAFEKKIIRSLNSCSPSLLYFDMYRLYRLNLLSKERS